MEPNNNIPEAEIITEEKPNDIFSRLDSATEPKTPTANTNSWNFGDEPEIKKEPEVKADNFAKETPPKIEPGKPNTTETVTGEPKLSKDLKLATARITVSALDSTQRVIFTPLINRKYFKKFTPDEIKTLDEKNLVDIDKKSLENEDLTLRNKFDRLMKTRDKKIKDIPFTDEESQDLEKIFYQYMDLKNSTLPPEISLTIGIVNVLGKRAIDLFTD